jgi:Uma2 family endonuclease
MMPRPWMGRKLTAEEFPWLAPEAKELVAGEPTPMTPVSFRHGRIAIRVALALREHASKQRLGEVVTEVGFVVRRSPDTVRAPDVAFVCAARLPGPDLDEGFFEGAPDLAVEVVSPTDRAAEIVTKVAEYLAAGTRLVWVIDPQAACLAVYRPTRGPDLIGPEGVVDGEDVLPGFSQPLAELLC